MKKLILTALAIGLVVNPTFTTGAEEDYNLSEDYTPYIEEIASMYGLCPELIQSLIWEESRGKTDIVSHCGAVGLMQVMPKYNQERMKELGVTDLTDPYSNILVGCDIIAELADKYEVYEALTAYNCGADSYTMQAVQNGGSWEYADNILERSAYLERMHGK